MKEHIAKRIFDVIDEGFILIEPDGQISYANPAAERILGLKKSEIQARNYVSADWEIVRPDGTPMPAEEMAGPRAMASRRTVRDVVMGVKRSDGAISWINVNATPLIAASGEFEGIAGAFTDITRSVNAEKKLQRYAEGLKEMVEAQTQELVESNRRLEDALRKDVLTGVANRRGFFERAELLIKLAERQEQVVTVGYLDIDNLKLVNDTLGHVEGDRLLAAIGGVLSRNFRSSDAVGRVGGDEFAAVLVGTPLSRSKALFGRLYKELLETARQRSYEAGVSIGVIVFLQAPPELGSALRAADALMYRAKTKQGVGVFYAESDENLDPQGESEGDQPG